MIAPPLCDLMVEKPPTKNKTTYTLNPATALWQRSWAYTLWFKKKERKKKKHNYPVSHLFAQIGQKSLKNCSTLR